MNQKSKEKIAIIGAGASGLASSIFLSKSNLDITIFEKNNKIGKKLLATGNGRCNVTNQNISTENFYSDSDINSIKQILHKFNYHKCKEFFSNMGVEFVFGNHGRAYPMSQTASSIVSSLEFTALDNGVKIKLNHEVKSIKDKGNGFLVDGEYFDKLIIATGSIAMPKLGSSDSGYDFAKQYNHKIIKPFASLVQLIANNKNLDMVSGVKINGQVNGVEDDILFTKYGLSGSGILDVSRTISKQLQTQKAVELSIDTMPNISKNKLVEDLLKRVKLLPNRDLDSWLDGIMNKKLSRYIIRNSNISSNIKTAKFLNRKDILKIVHTIKNLSFTIVDTKGFESCEVCAGGVDIKQINLNTMESKLRQNLYFTGEVMDIDGDCGGYNLHWAWASSYILSKNIKSGN